MKGYQTEKCRGFVDWITAFEAVPKVENQFVIARNPREGGGTRQSQSTINPYIARILALRDCFASLAMTLFLWLSWTFGTASMPCPYNTYGRGNPAHTTPAGSGFLSFERAKRVENSSTISGQSLLLLLHAQALLAWSKNKIQGRFR